MLIGHREWLGKKDVAKFENETYLAVFRVFVVTLLRKRG